MKPRKAKSKTRKEVQFSNSDVVLTRFYREKCTQDRGALNLILDNIVNITFSANCSLRSQVEQIAVGAHREFRIESLSNELEAVVLSKGGIICGAVSSCIDRIAVNYPNMWWWITDNGLNMACLEPKPVHSRLCEFDAFAGKLMDEHRKAKRISKDSLILIAKALDAKSFLLRDYLQPGYWKAIAEHNKSKPKQAIRTFSQAVQKDRFVRGVRKRLCVAREKFRADQIRVRELI